MARRPNVGEVYTWDGIDVLFHFVAGGLSGKQNRRSSMPELGGRELAESALKLRPGLKVLFMSGHTPDVVLKEGVQKGTAFLQKPFTPVALAQKVRETLDSDVRGL